MDAVSSRAAGGWAVNRAWRSACLAAAGAAMLIMPAQAPAQPAHTAGAGAAPRVDAPPALPATLTGAYLAGSVALARNELGDAAHFMASAQARDPGNDRLRNLTFHLMVRDGRLAAAARLAAQQLEARPDDRLAHMVLMADAVRTGDFAEARRQAAEVERRDIAALTMPVIEAWIDTALGDTEGALERLDALAETAGVAPLVRMHQGLILDISGDKQSAREVLEGAVEPGMSLRMVQALGSLYERTGQPGKARSLYEQYLEENPNSMLIEPALARLEAGTVPPPLVAAPAEGIAEALFQIGSALHGEGVGDEALIHARLADHLRPDFALGRILLGDVLAALGNYDDAIAAYRSVDAGAAEAWSARLQLGRTLLEMERYDDAMALLTALAAERPDRGEPLMAVGDVHRTERRFEAAVAAYDGAADRSPELSADDWTFFYRRGIALERASQWQRAENDLQRAIDLNPDHAHLLNYLGYSWIDRGENLAEAEGMVRRAVEMRPDDGFIVDSLGWLYYRTGRLDEAVRTLERAVELEPEDAVINDHLGDAYWVVGRRAEARFQWQRALRMLEDDPELEQAIRDKLAHGLTDPGFVVAPGEPLPYEATPIEAGRNRIPADGGEPL